MREGRSSPCPGLGLKNAPTGPPASLQPWSTLRARTSTHGCPCPRQALGQPNRAALGLVFWCLGWALPGTRGASPWPGPPAPGEAAGLATSFWVKNKSKNCVFSLPSWPGRDRTVAASCLVLGSVFVCPSVRSCCQDLKLLYVSNKDVPGSARRCVLASRLCRGRGRMP